VGDNVGDNVGANVGANVRANVRANVVDNMVANVWANVGANVRNNVWNNVRNNVWNNVSANVWNNAGDIKIEPICSYGDINDYGWVAFYDYFTQIGILKNEHFEKFIDLISSNYFTMIQMSNICVVAKNPSHIYLNERKQMNSISDYAIKFHDGTGMHFVNGRYMNDSLFKKLSNKEYTPDEFFKEKNEEVKSSAIAFMQQAYGDEYVAGFLRDSLTEVHTFVDKKNGKFLEGTTGGMNVGVYTLFKGEINDTAIAYVRCYCPSTDRMFFLGVNPAHTNAKDAIASLYTIPTKLKPHIKGIARQGERFSTTFTDKGAKILKELTSDELKETTSITGDEYFSLMTYEF
jgi:hypothetical protein